VLDLMTTMIDRGHSHYIWLDNLFTSYKLLSALRDRGIGGAGTSRSNTCITEREKAEDKAGMKKTEKTALSNVVKPQPPKRGSRKNRQSKSSQTLQEVIEETDLPGNAQFQFLDNRDDVKIITNNERPYVVLPVSPMAHLLPHLEMAIDPSLQENQNPPESFSIPSGSGIVPELAELKLKYGQRVGWGRRFIKATDYKRIVQFAWKDTAIVLFQSTVGNPSDLIQRPRKRPSNGGTKTELDEVWGDSFVKDLEIPILIDHYNHRMNAVDLMDQIRSYYSTQRRTSRTWRPLFTFLFEASLSNTWRIAESLQYTQSIRASGHRKFRKRLSQALMASNRRIRALRKSKKASLVQKTPFKISEDPVKEQLGTFTIENCSKGTLVSLGILAGYCYTCQQQKKTVSGTKRKALSELSINSLHGSERIQGRRAKRPRSTYGCSICLKHFCRKAECWENHFC
jgi:hypothetical protein